tara:strand:- start:226 stop:906 length:681 start_codon:yes stop_codon:yes gene_type:complete
MSMLDDLYKPDYKSRLSSAIIGRPGSGKSVYISFTLQEFLKRNKDGNYRCVYICPKHEMRLSDKKEHQPIRADQLEKHLRKNRVAIVYPEIEYIDAETDYVIDLLFAIERENEGFSATLIIDDAQTFLSSRSVISPAFRRLALTGRSRGIRLVYVSHSIIFHKDLEGSTSYMILFNIPFKQHWTDSIKRYGFNPEPYAEQLASTPYSHVWFDISTTKARLYPPLEI